MGFLLFLALKLLKRLPNKLCGSFCVGDLNELHITKSECLRINVTSDTNPSSLRIGEQMIGMQLCHCSEKLWAYP